MKEIRMELKPVLPVSHFPLVVAGPCSAETRLQTLETAKQLAATGRVAVFRAGVWKPRTMPGSFEGVGATALEWLAEVKRLTGMPVATEVATREHVLAALSHGIDIMWIGARTTTNPFAVQEIADIIGNESPDVAVFVKNPVNPDLGLWIGALQRLYNAGIKKLAAVHRGFSVYAHSIYRNEPQWNISIELRRLIPGLPILHDPSHTGGSRELLLPLSQQALDVGFDGLFVESHCSPETALSDASQQVTPEELEDILSAIVIRRENSPSESLSDMRRRVDELDMELVNLLARRMEVCREIGRYKRAEGMPVLQENRYSSLLEGRIMQGEKMGLPASFMQRLLETVHAESVRQQLDIMNSLDNDD